MEVLDEGKSRETVAAKKKRNSSQKNWEMEHKITDWNKFTEFAKKHGDIGNG